MVLAAYLLLAQKPTESPMVVLDPKGGVEFRVGALSADGQTVVGTLSDPKNSSKAAYWTKANKFVPLFGKEMAKVSTLAQYVSADGSVISGEIWPDDRPFYGFRWRKTKADYFKDPALNASVAGMSDDGKVIAIEAVDFDTKWKGYVERAGKRTPLESHAGFNTLQSMAGLSGDGRFVIGAATGSNTQMALRWDEKGKPIALGSPQDPSHMKLPTAISRDGSTVLGIGMDQRRALVVLWQNGKTIRLFDPNDASIVQADAGALSPDGVIVGGTIGRPDKSSTGFLWTAKGGLVDLRKVIDKLGYKYPAEIVFSNVVEVTARGDQVFICGMMYKGEPGNHVFFWARFPRAYLSKG